MRATGVGLALVLASETRGDGYVAQCAAKQSVMFSLTIGD